jgi:plasmid maintenance system antidote protein VapI
VNAALLMAMQNEYDMLMAERDDSFVKKLKQIAALPPSSNY